MSDHFFLADHTCHAMVMERSYDLGCSLFFIRALRAIRGCLVRRRLCSGSFRRKLFAASCAVWYVVETRDEWRTNSLIRREQGVPRERAIIPDLKSNSHARAA